MEFLAKSNPKETIQEHTDNLLKQLNTLRTLYPNIPINWKLLEYACVLHDLGKINEKFQKKIKFGKRDPKEIPHSLLSLLFIDPDKLDLSEEEIVILFHSIAYHHERDFSDIEIEDIENEVESLKRNIDKFVYDKLPKLEVQESIEDYYFTLGDRIYKREQKTFKNYVLVKGLLNKLDYAASAHIEVEQKNDFLRTSLNNLGYKWNDLQKFAIENENKNIIVTAQTGMGKTEAGLLWIGDNKGFYTLPLKVSINAIYDRIIQKILKGENKEKVGILHSDSFFEYVKRENLFENTPLDVYYTKTKQLSLALTISTLDQLFDIVYRYRGFEVKLATLSYSKIIIDEVQMYSSQLLAYLIIGLKMITDFGGKFAILTATLPEVLLDYLNKYKIEYELSPPFTNNLLRHSVKVIEDVLNPDLILKLYNRNRILVICNTVRKAQQIYNELRQRIPECEVKLLHSKFIKMDRDSKENEIIKLGKNYNGKGIWITTPIVEASLDIDFDILVTELSDINSLFQRLGRVYRKRAFKGDYNAFIFIGDESNNPSGVGTIIDEDIFKLSRSEIKKIDGYLHEMDKMNLVKKVYSKAKLKETKYLENLEKNLNYVKSFKEYEADKNEIRKIFRDIDSITIIPKPVYNKFKDKIKNIIEKYKLLTKSIKESKDNEERKNILKEIYLNKMNLYKYTTSLGIYEIGKYKKEYIELNDRETITIVDCEYSSELGAITATKTNEDLDNII
ncbi:CRISPR-associated helicase/endonuclease Cas3 [Thermosipho atlanticus]|uniref:CRISPR-associated endonuclease/helicase Cas3 n=1 Tax=Thermosipho atlanticus DSM 15807 TaxID=1123380 RepID=A0A1M5U4U8_9BACT|nr:CRISPR-associated helicase/endonuclease Cas3 [Thermosipho atlanticus]SHH57713.1 CRISPR-associated endonuclease/helicase Cas3 [Thermosipho atlanticus DSM 15807]